MFVVEVVLVTVQSNPTVEVLVEVTVVVVVVRNVELVEVVVA